MIFRLLHVLYIMDVQVSSKPFLLFCCCLFVILRFKKRKFNEQNGFKGCRMGPWLGLVSPCLGENEVATCKIRYFLCSLDNLLQKNVIVFFFGNQNSKWRPFEKRAIFDLFFTFFSHQGKVTKFLQHISHSHTYTYFAHPIDFFCLTNFENKIRIYQVQFLFGMSPGVDSYSSHFGTINK